MKPQKFDGNGSFETFLYQFENCAKYNKWNSDDKVAHLRWSLTGIAAQLMWGTEDLRYKQLIDKLRARFGGAGMEEKFQNELRCRRRAKGESLRELTQDIRRLMALAYPGEKSSLAEHIVRDAFLAALDDPEFELKIREHEPFDLDDAVKTGLRFEVFKNAVEHSSSARHRINRQVREEGGNNNDSAILETRLVALEQRFKQPARNNERDTRKNRATVNGEQRWKEDMNERLKNLEVACKEAEDRARRAMEDNGTLSKEVDRLTHLEQLRLAQQSAMHSGVVPSNFPPPIQPPPARQRDSGACFRCGIQGHFARNCPIQQQPVSPEAVIAALPASGSAESSLYVSGTTEKDQLGKGRFAYVRGIINGRELDCLLDTGSEISLLPATIVSSHLLSPTSQILTAANRTPIPVLGEATVPLSMGTYHASVTGLVSEHVAEVMLGIERLTANDAIWNFRTACLQLQGTEHRLKDRRGEKKWCRRVVLAECTGIPARSQAILTTKVVCKPRRDSPHVEQWSTEPWMITPGVHVSRTLVPTDRLNHIPVRVVNVLQHPVILNSGAVVADLQPATVRQNDGPTNGQTATDEIQLHIQHLLDSIDPSSPKNFSIKLRELLLSHSNVFSE
jgi:hypothetical protein